MSFMKIFYKTISGISFPPGFMYHWASYEMVLLMMIKLLQAGNTADINKLSHAE